MRDEGMIKKSVALLLFIIALPLCSSSAPFVVHAEPYKHKSEAEIARMTPAQRVDEWVNEQVHHRFDLEDDHADIIKKYILHDGLAALPHMMEIMDEYDPTRFPEGKERRGERFDACWLMLGYIDEFAVRLRGSEEGRHAINALEGTINRMRAANYGQEDQHEWPQHGRFNLALIYLGDAKGINLTDQAIRDTLRREYKILLSEEELLAFSNFMAVHYSDYPSWSEQNFVNDSTRVNEAGNPIWVHTMKKPERFYEAYLEFKKTK